MPTGRTREGRRSITCVRLRRELVCWDRLPVASYIAFSLDGRWSSNGASGRVNSPRGGAISNRYLYELSPMGSDVALVWTVDGVVVQRN